MVDQPNSADCICCFRVDRRQFQDPDFAFDFVRWWLRGQRSVGSTVVEAHRHGHGGHVDRLPSDGALDKRFTGRSLLGHGGLVLFVQVRYKTTRMHLLGVGQLLMKWIF